jgi:hypothetical protein
MSNKGYVCKVGQRNNLTTPRLACVLWITWPSFDRQPIRRTPHFPGLEAEVALTLFLGWFDLSPADSPAIEAISRHLLKSIGRKECKALIPHSIEKKNKMEENQIIEISKGRISSSVPRRRPQRRKDGKIDYLKMILQLLGPMNILIHKSPKNLR